MTNKKIYKKISDEKAAKLKGKYLLNGKTLHIIGNCHHTKHIFTNTPIFDTEDDAIASETRYMHYCKLCFKK